jgi:hypothetical protein
MMRRETGAVLNHFLRSLDALALVGAHIASGRIFGIGARLAPLIGLEQMTKAVGAASGVASINSGLPLSRGIVGVGPP